MEVSFLKWQNLCKKTKYLGFIILCCISINCNDQAKVNEHVLDDSLIETELKDSFEKDTNLIFDISEKYRGILSNIAGNYKVTADSFIYDIFEQDYSNINSLLDLYPDLFTVTAKPLIDNIQGNNDSIVSFKFKTSFLEFKKESRKKSKLLEATLTSEVFMLPNGIHVGMDMDEILESFGINAQINSNTLYIVTSNNSQKIKLTFLNKELIKMELRTN